MHGFHFGIGIPPAERRVVGSEIAKGKSRFCLWEGVWCPAHGFDSAGNVDLPFSRFDGACRHVDGVQAGSAQTIDRHAAHFHRQTRQQRRHACHVAVIFTGLIGAAHENFFNGSRVNLIPFYNGFDDMRRHVIGAHRREDAAQRSNGRANGIDDHDFGHEILQSLMLRFYHP